jgi:ribose transport system permease protein
MTATAAPKPTDKATTENTPAGSGPQRAAGRPAWLSAHNLERFALPGAWVLLLLAFSAILPGNFATAGNYQNIFGSQAVLLIMAAGSLIPFTAGEYDMSIASTMSLSAMTLSVLNVQHGVPLGASIAAAIAVGLLAGALNGFFVVVLKVSSLIATLGSGTLFLGIVYWMSNSSTVTGIDRSLSTATAGSRVLLGLQPQFFYGLAVVAVIAFVLSRTPYGRRLLFVGQGRQVAHLSGLKVDRIRAGSFIASGLVMSLAGIVYAGSLNGADPSSGQSFLMPALAACFLGSTAFIPGRFNAWGTLVAVYFLYSGVVGLQMLGAKNFVQDIFYGGALIAAVALSQAIRHKNAATRS